MRFWKLDVNLITSIFTTSIFFRLTRITFVTYWITVRLRFGPNRSVIRPLLLMLMFVTVLFTYNLLLEIYL